MGVVVERLALLEDAEERLHAHIHLGPDRCHVQLDGDAAQLLDRAGAADAAIADERHRLAAPFEGGGIERVLQHCGGPMIIFRGSDDEAVIFADLVAPGLGGGVRIDALGPGRGDGLFEQRQILVAQVERVEREVVARGGAGGDPLGGNVRETLRARTADDECEVEHGNFDPFRLRIVTGDQMMRWAHRHKEAHFWNPGTSM